MTDRFRRYLTSVLALGLGAALGRAGWQDRRVASARDAASFPSEVTPADAIKSVSSRNYRLAERQTKMNPESSALSAAWNSLKSGKHSRGQRFQLQTDIIEKWSSIDPESAIGAVLADVPDTDESDRLLVDCELALDKEPGHALQMLEKEPFGIDTGRIRRSWLFGRAYRDPLDTLALVDQLSPLDRRKVVDRVVNLLLSGLGVEADREAIWSRLLESHGGPAWESDSWAISERIMNAEGPQMEVEQRNKLLEATDPATLDLRAAWEARELLKDNFTEAQVKQRLPFLPAEIRDAVLKRWKLHRKSEP